MKLIVKLKLQVKEIPTEDRHLSKLKCQAFKLPA